MKLYSHNKLQRTPISEKVTLVIHSLQNSLKQFKKQGCHFFEEKWKNFINLEREVFNGIESKIEWKEQNKVLIYNSKVKVGLNKPLSRLKGAHMRAHIFFHKKVWSTMKFGLGIVTLNGNQLGRRNAEMVVAALLHFATTTFSVPSFSIMALGWCLAIEKLWKRPLLCFDVFLLVLVPN